MNSERTKQHICKPLQTNPAKELFFANEQIKISAAFPVCCQFIDSFYYICFKKKQLSQQRN
jgi:hypothetical protein